MQNRTIQNDLEAWLMFLSTDDPQRILDLIDAYPKFRELYNDIYTICCNTESVMEMFSEELKILDDNTVQYMIDIMQEKLDSQNKQIQEDALELNQKDLLIEQKDLLLEQKEQQLIISEQQTLKFQKEIEELRKRITLLEK